MKISVDASKTVAPLQTQKVGATSSGTASDKRHELLKYKTITKYSWFESGTKWVKVLLPDLAGLGEHPKDKVSIEFPT